VSASTQTETATPDGRSPRPPFWRDVRIIRIALQVGFLLAVAALLFWLFDNLTVNLRVLGIRRDFAFLGQPTGVPILGSDFRAQSPIRDALLVGFFNILRVAVPGILTALVIGTLVGVGRLSTNWLVRRAAGIYVEVLRNVPPLVMLIFFYIAVLQQLPAQADSITAGPFALLNVRGVYLPALRLDGPAPAFLGVLAVALAAAIVLGMLRTRRFDATGQPHRRVPLGVGLFLAIALLGWLFLGRPLGLELPVVEGRGVAGGYRMIPEQASVFIALVLYTSSFIAEIVRGSIQAVARGQTEASDALGLSGLQRLRFVVLPQALRIATPAGGNEFLNFTKNVSLGVFVAYPELLRIGRQAVGNGFPAPQLLFIVSAGYLTLSLAISLVTNLVNRRLQLAER
jgi:general L-amino acid transport system permease protein